MNLKKRICLNHCLGWYAKAAELKLYGYQLQAKKHTNTNKKQISSLSAFTAHIKHCMTSSHCQHVDRFWGKQINWVNRKYKNTSSTWICGCING